MSQDLILDSLEHAMPYIRMTLRREDIFLSVISLHGNSFGEHRVFLCGLCGFICYFIRYQR